MKTFLKTTALIFTGGALIGLGAILINLILEKRHKIYFEMGIRDME